MSIIRKLFFPRNFVCENLCFLLISVIFQEKVADDRTLTGVTDFFSFLFLKSGWKNIFKNKPDTLEGDYCVLVRGQ